MKSSYIGDRVLDPHRIREDFPILKNRKIIYLDNAATSQKPIQVIDAVKEFYEFYNANIHRGIHTLGREASKIYEEAREEVAKFIGAEDPKEIVFVKNTTEALNTIAYSLAFQKLSKDDEIITTIMEHHSNLLPWYMISKLIGTKLRIVKITHDHKLNYYELEELISKRTKIVAITHVSNVLGTINDVRKIARLAHEIGAYVVVDGAQSVPHLPINVKDLDLDFLVFSGHKMLGPTGIGVLYCKIDIIRELKPFFYGGGMVKEVHFHNDDLEIELEDPPWRFEAGTPNTVSYTHLTLPTN